MRDLGTLVWVILVIIGIISSIRSNVKKAQQARVQAARPAAGAPPPPKQDQRVMQTMTPAFVDLAAVPVAVPVAAPLQAPQPVRRVRPPSTPFSIPMVAVESTAVRTASPVRGMFGRGSIVRAIVAAEVLGPPKSEQERSIWSPRHNEPSI